MHIPKSKINIKTFEIKDKKLIDYLYKNEIVPINEFNDTFSYVESDKLLNLIEQYNGEVKDG